MVTKKFRCLRCKRFSTDYPALSRRDNKTDICSDCGVQEALFDFRVSREDPVRKFERKWLDDLNKKKRTKAKK